jgi:hypothetical protein
MKTQKRAMAPILARARAGGTPRAIGVLTIGNASLQVDDGLEPQPADPAFLPPTVKWCKMRLSFAEDG